MEHAMLPPVRAALSSTADYHNQTQAAVTPARVTSSLTTAQSQSGSNATLSGARLDAASLSAQLKLAQGSSILAETIGKLLKTPRRENETLIDYTARLFEAVQALKPQEVANVERLLNQIVKGISLRLMAEILKEPSGPAAARLAAHIETANIAQRDLAAKTVVSFYRQNGSTDTPPAGNGPRLQQAASPAAAQTGQISPTQATSNDDHIASLRQPAGNEASPKLGEGQNQRSPAPAPASPELKPQQAEQASKPASSITGPAIASASQAPTSRPVTPTSEAVAAAKPTMSMTGLKDGSQANAVRSEIIPGRASTPTTVISNQLQISATQVAQQAVATEPEEMQALARTAVEMFKLDIPVPARLWSSLSDQTLLKLATWLATALSELDLPETKHLPMSSPAVQTATDDGLADQQRAAGNAPSASTSHGGQTAASPQTANGATPDAARAAAAAARADMPEQNMAALAIAANTVPTQAREALPWPYVAAYPPADEEPRHRERQAEPIEALEDEEQDESSQQHAFGDEHEPEGEEPQDDDTEGEEIISDTMTRAEKAAGYRAGEARLEADVPEVQPSDLYWRMAGWT
jgi:hypothetical protein